MLSGEIVSPNRLIFQYMKVFTKSEKLKEFIASKMSDLITFLDKNGKSDVYDGGVINVIYSFLDMIGAPTTLTTSGHRSHHFGSSSSRKNDATTLHPVIAALRMRHKSICECCGRNLGHG